MKYTSTVNGTNISTSKPMLSLPVDIKMCATNVNSIMM